MKDAVSKTPDLQVRNAIDMGGKGEYTHMCVGVKGEGVGRVRIRQCVWKPLKKVCRKKGRKEEVF